MSGQGNIEYSSGPSLFDVNLQQLALMTLDEAQKGLAEKPDDLACRKVVLLSKLFKSDYEAQAFFTNRKLIHDELQIYKARVQIAQLRLTGPLPLKDFEPNLITLELNCCKACIEKLSEGKTQLESPFSQGITFLHKLNLAESQDTLFSEEIQAAKADVEHHKAMVMRTLQTCNADLSREDLIKCLIGPEQYLLDHYDVEANGTVFVYKKDPSKTFTLSLDYNGSYHLEEAILVGCGKNKYEHQIFKHENYTRPLRAELKEFQKRALFLISNWSNAEVVSDADVAEFKTKLFSLNKWDKFNFKPQQLRLAEKKDVKESDIVRGDLRAFGFEYEVIFSCDRFAISIRGRKKAGDPTRYQPTLWSVDASLRMLEEDSKPYQLFRE
jgi:hypothetical protein